MASTSMELIISLNIMALPCEVLMDILSRLPLKQVHQLETVSKQWYRTISSPHFRRLYNLKSMTRPRALVVHKSDETYSMSGIGPISRIMNILTMDLGGDKYSLKIQKEFSFKIVRREYSFRVSSNLIIFQGQVCNPTTREIIDLPTHSALTSFSYDVGYIPCSNTYKIVHLFGTKRGPNYTYNYGHEILELGFETLTLRDGGPIPSSWQSLAHRERFSLLIDTTCVNGVMYWLVGIRGKKEGHIVSMEIENDEFFTIDCPKEADHDEELFGQGRLADINGKLCVAYYSNELLSMNLFFLKDHDKNQEWVKEYTIDFSGICMEDRWFKIVGYVPLQANNGDILIDGYKQSLLYNIEEKRFRRLPKFMNNIHIGLYFERCFKLGSTINLPLQPNG